MKRSRHRRSAARRGRKAGQEAARRGSPTAAAGKPASARRTHRGCYCRRRKAARKTEPDRKPASREHPQQHRAGNAGYGPRAMMPAQIGGSPAPLRLRGPADLTAKDANILGKLGTVGKSGAKPLAVEPIFGGRRRSRESPPQHRQFARRFRINALGRTERPLAGRHWWNGGGQIGIRRNGQVAERGPAVIAEGRPADGRSAAGLPRLFRPRWSWRKLAAPEVAEGAFNRLLAKNGIAWSNAPENEIIPRAAENLAAPSRPLPRRPKSRRNARKNGGPLADGRA